MVQTDPGLAASPLKYPTTRQRDWDMAEGTKSLRLPSPGQDLAEGRVPVEDGAIQSAFDKLDAQMDAWLSAMKRAEQVLAAGVAACGTSTAHSPELPTGGSPLSAKDTSRSVAPLSIEKAASQSQAARSSSDSDQPATAAPSSIDVESDETCEAPAAATDADAGEQPSGSLSSAPAPAAVSAATQRAEDEALLATLDEETARSIRMMRRMCMNQKSVKELLVEYEAKKDSQPAGADTKKSWFRRGK